MAMPQQMTLGFGRHKIPIKQILFIVLNGGQRSKADRGCQQEQPVRLLAYWRVCRWKTTFHSCRSTPLQICSMTSAVAVSP